MNYFLQQKIVKLIVGFPIEHFFVSQSYVLLFHPFWSYLKKRLTRFDRQFSVDSKKSWALSSVDWLMKKKWHKTEQLLSTEEIGAQPVKTGKNVAQPAEAENVA